MTLKERAAMQQALKSLEKAEFKLEVKGIGLAVITDSITALREALAEHEKWMRGKPIVTEYGVTCREAEQDHFAASGKPIVEQTNTQLMEGYRIGLAEMREKCAKVCEELKNYYGVGTDMELCAAAIRAINFEGDTGFRPLSEMIAEHKQAEQEPVAWYSDKGGFNECGEGQPLYAAPQTVTTPDVCGEVCVRAKLCYGCGMALDEANRIHEERFDYELDNAPFRGMGEVSPSTKLYMKELQETLSEKADRKHALSSECPKCGHKVISTHTGEVWRCPKCQYEWPCEKQSAKQPVQKVDLTDDEIVTLAGFMRGGTMAEFARAVIAKLREKERQK